MEKLFNSKLILIYGVTLLGIMSVGLIAPALPLIAVEYDLSPARLSLLITLYTLPGIFISVPVGIMADRIGRRRILVPSLLLFGFTGGIVYFVSDYEIILWMRLLHGIGGAALTSLAITLIGDIYRDPQRTKAMGVNAAILSVGTGVFPLAGGLLSLVSWRLPFLLFFVAVPWALMIRRGIPRTVSKDTRPLGEYFRGVGRYFFSAKSLLLYSSCTFFFLFLYGYFLAFLPLFLTEKFSASSDTIGYIIASSAISTAVIASRIEYIGGRIGAYRLIPLGFAVIGLSLGLIPLAENSLTLYLAALLYGSGMGLALPIIQSLITGLAPTVYRGVMASLYGAVVRLGQTLGPQLTAPFWEILSKDVFYFSGAAFSFVLALIYMLAILISERKSIN